MDESLPWEQRYQQLDAHHQEETAWMISEIQRLEAENRELRKDLTTWCDAIDNPGEGRCRKRATQRVTWSDRELFVCDAHVAYAKHAAAHDHSYDRSDDPYIDGVSRHPLALDEWPDPCPRRGF